MSFLVGSSLGGWLAAPPNSCFLLMYFPPSQGSSLVGSPSMEHRPSPESVHDVSEFDIMHSMKRATIGKFDDSSLHGTKCHIRNDASRVTTVGTPANTALTLAGRTPVARHSARAHVMGDDGDSAESNQIRRMKRCKFDSEIFNLPPEFLVGKRIEVQGMGPGEVLSFERRPFLITSSHVIEFDLPEYGQQDVVLRRRKLGFWNSGRQFSLIGEGSKLDQFRSSCSPSFNSILGDVLAARPSVTP